MNQNDIECMITIQKELSQCFEKVNEMLTNFNARTISLEVKEPIQMDTVLRKDLDSMFKGISIIRAKIKTQYLDYQKSALEENQKYLEKKPIKSLSNGNTLSMTTSGEVNQFTQKLKELCKDLDSTFKKISIIMTEIKSQYLDFHKSILEGEKEDLEQNPVESSSSDSAGTMGHLKTSLEVKVPTQMVTELHKDLDSAFKRVSTIRAKIKSLYSDNHKNVLEEKQKDLE